MPSVRVVFACLLLAAYVVGSRALVAGDAPPRPSDAKDAKPHYVGDKACFPCHRVQHAAWSATALAKSMAPLAPSKEGEPLHERKKAAKLDPARDYSADPACLGCHTTGYGESGGYPRDAAAGDDAAKLAKRMGKVSCEACHGPGSAYVDFKTEAMRAARDRKEAEPKFTAEQLAPFGLVRPDARNCAVCHNANNPINAAFSFEDAKAKVHPKPAAKPAK